MSTTTPGVMMVSDEDDKLADDIGMKIPAQDCILSWDDFKNHVVGKNYIELYDISDNEMFISGMTTKVHLRYSLLNDTVIKRDLSLRIDDTNTCAYVPGLEERVDSEKAIFRALSGFTVSPTRMDFVVSSDPSKYLFYFFCYTGDTIMDGRCSQGLNVLLVEDKRSWPQDGDGVPEGQINLDDIPWGDIERTMIRCFGQQFLDDTDPQAIWTWRGKECAVPGSDVYNEAVMGT
ncbi:uncharacterized protein LOC132725890 [Ruditapes philippinarum]|uniref:uncharacterized protein LOC132725890 n=1 Tax=Ruditapes philippinarum TaxID=129788 RepID=UPI00295B3FB9|nr:uncharacterized protein LOC132725890 [Ruditapes philippinarum]